MAESQGSVITDAMRAEIGEGSAPVTVDVDNPPCRMFARAVGYTDPIYYDEKYARSKGYRNIAAPFAFLGHLIFNPNAPQRLGGYFRTDTPFKRVLNGGTDVEYLDTVCAGDVLAATSKLAALIERAGRLGPLPVAA